MGKIVPVLTTQIVLLLIDITMTKNKTLPTPTTLQKRIMALATPPKEKA